MIKAPSRYLEGVYMDTFINTIWIPPPFGGQMEATKGMYRGTLVCRERFSNVPQNFLQFLNLVF
jgi:hypothetical protein